MENKFTPGTVVTVNGQHRLDYVGSGKVCEGIVTIATARTRSSALLADKGKILTHVKYYGDPTWYVYLAIISSLSIVEKDYSLTF